MPSSGLFQKLPLDIKFEIYSQVFKSKHTILITPRPRKTTVFDALILSCKQIKREIEKWAISLPQGQKHLYHLFGIFNADNTYFKICFERHFHIYQRLWTPKEAEANEFRDIQLWQKMMNKMGTTCTCAWDDTVTGSWDVEHAYPHSACNKHTSFHAWFCHLDRLRGIILRSYSQEHFSLDFVNTLLTPQAFRGTGSPWEDALYTGGWGKEGRRTYASGPLFANSKPCDNYYWEWDFKTIWEEHMAICPSQLVGAVGCWALDGIFQRWRMAIGYSEKARRGEGDGCGGESEPVPIELPRSARLSGGSKDADSEHPEATPSHALPSPPKTSLQEKLKAWALYEAQEKCIYLL
jgi:hypothetical protein